MLYYRVEINIILNTILLLNNDQLVVYNIIIAIENDANCNKRWFLIDGLIDRIIIFTFIFFLIYYKKKEKYAIDFVI